MKLLQVSYPAPAENLACDEALLDECEETGTEVLRIWESPTPFVVVGYGNEIAMEVNRGACDRAGVPILRRCSGGGTVVQGEGCLNYALALRAAEDGPLGTVTATNRFIMERNRAAFEKLLGRNVAVQGHTDLAMLELSANDHTPGKWLKFSGNAQRRRRESVLFHGTILYSFDLPLIARLLKAPSKQPEYRDDREHLAFVRNIPAAREAIVAALAAAWGVAGTLDKAPDERVAQLVTNRYSTSQWNEAR